VLKSRSLKLVVVVAVVGCLTTSAIALEQGLVAHYPLVEDTRDAAGTNDGANHHVTFVQGKGAYFNGLDAFIEVPDAPALHLGTGPFSISAWINTNERSTDTLGDIAGKFDPDTRKGFNLLLQNFQGVASSQANFRNLFFGIDDARIDPEWTDRGRPGKSLLVFSLAVFKGALYAGTFEEEGPGRVYRLEGDTWVDCGAPHPSNAVSALAVHEDQLYAGTSRYRAGGSALPDAENDVPGGHVYRYDGDGDWRDLGKLGESEAIGGLVSFNGALYGSSLYAPAGLYRMRWGGGWDHLGSPGGRTVPLTVHNGSIYGGGYDAEFGGVYRFDPNGTWTDCGTPPDTTQTYSFMTHFGELYVGTWPTGKVFRYGGEQTWLDEGQLGEELEVMGMVVYNGKLYGGTLPLAEVYRFDGTGQWHNTGQIDTTPDVKYRRAWTMAVHDGQLFAGTLPSGRVYSLEAGKAVSHDHALRDGWRHVAAVRAEGALRLYVDGELVGMRSLEGDAFDLGNDRPLTIGFGAHDHFQGFMNNVRIYDRALREEEVTALADYEAHGQGIALDLPMKHWLTAGAEPEESQHWKISDFRRSGAVHVEDGVAFMERGDDMSGITWRGPLLRMNYEISLDAQRVAGGDFFCALTFPYGEDPCSLILGGWGGSTVGLSSLDYMDASSNETSTSKNFENGRWYGVRLRVTEGRIQAWIDEHQYVDADVAGRHVGIRWEVDKSLPLGISTWRTTGAVRNITLRALDDWEIEAAAAE